MADRTFLVYCATCEMGEVKKDLTIAQQAVRKHLADKEHKASIWGQRELATSIALRAPKAKAEPKAKRPKKVKAAKAA